MFVIHPQTPSAQSSSPSPHLNLLSHDSFFIFLPLPTQAPLWFPVCYRYSTFNT